MRLFGSLRVFSLVNFFFMPSILEQKLLRRAASFSVFGFGAGGFKFMPSALAEARPLAFKPPFGSLPSALCHAGDLGLANFGLHCGYSAAKFDHVGVRELRLAHIVHVHDKLHIFLGVHPGAINAI